METSKQYFPRCSPCPAAKVPVLQQAGVSLHSSFGKKERYACGIGVQSAVCPFPSFATPQCAVMQPRDPDATLHLTLTMEAVAETRLPLQGCAKTNQRIG